MAQQNVQPWRAHVHAYLAHHRIFNTDFTYVEPGVQLLQVDVLAVLEKPASLLYNVGPMPGRTIGELMRMTNEERPVRYWKYVGKSLHRLKELMTWLVQQQFAERQLEPDAVLRRCCARGNSTPPAVEVNAELCLTEGSANHVQEYLEQHSVFKTGDKKVRAALRSTNPCAAMSQLPASTLRRVGSRHDHDLISNVLQDGAQASGIKFHKCVEQSLTYVRMVLARIQVARLRGLAQQADTVLAELIPEDEHVSVAHTVVNWTGSPDDPMAQRTLDTLVLPLNDRAFDRAQPNLRRRGDPPNYNGNVKDKSNINDGLAMIVRELNTQQPGRGRAVVLDAENIHTTRALVTRGALRAKQVIITNPHAQPIVDRQRRRDDFADTFGEVGIAQLRFGEFIHRPELGEQLTRQTIAIVYDAMCTPGGNETERPLENIRQAFQCDVLANAALFTFTYALRQLGGAQELHRQVSQTLQESAEAGGYTLLHHWGMEYRSSRAGSKMGFQMVVVVRDSDLPDDLAHRIGAAVDAATNRMSTSTSNHPYKCFGTIAI